MIRGAFDLKNYSKTSRGFDVTDLISSFGGTGENVDYNYGRLMPSWYTTASRDKGVLYILSTPSSQSVTSVCDVTVCLLLLSPT